MMDNLPASLKIAKLARSHGAAKKNVRSTHESDT